MPQPDRIDTTVGVSTLAYFVVYLGLREVSGAQAANLIALLLTSGSLWALHHLVTVPGRHLEVTVLILANAAATVIRFLALRQLVGRTPRAA